MTLPFWQRMRLFQKAATGIMILFFGLMLLVSVVAFTRRSGGTGMDMAQVQKMRYESNQKQIVRE